MTLQEIKDQYAKSLNGMTWDQVTMDRSLFDSAVDEVAKRYATECCKASLEKAADNANAGFNPFNSTCFVEKITITNPENIVLC
jgi:hypothetical protein